ncbi:MAG: replication initiation and membrane attachment family protein [Bacilli bacterium]
MTKENILPADTFIVLNKTILSEQDRKLLIMLYQPIIGQLGISMYFTLWSYLDKIELQSNECTHHHLMTNMRIKLNEILESRIKLEAIGLLKTYIKKGNINSYIYEIFSPVSAAEFMSNPILNVALYNNVGTSEFQKIVNYFKLPKINTKDFEEITSSFSDVFESSNISNFETLSSELRKKTNNKLELLSKIDLEHVFTLIPTEIFDIKNLTKETKDLIYKLAFIYNLDEDRISEIIRNSLNDKRLIDKKLLRSNFRNYYQFENSGKLPSLIYRNQPIYLRKPIGDNSNKAKIIYQFETTTPYDFLSSKYNGIKPSKSDLLLLENLMLEMNLKPGVVNVLIDYVLKINSNKLVKNFIETIARQWSISKVETVENAMKLAEKEYKSRKNYQEKKIIKTPTKPDRFDKDISKIEASNEKMEEMKELFKEYK